MNKRLTSLGLLLAVIANALFAYLVIVRGMDQLHQEAALLESLQAGFLFLGTLVFFAVACRAEKQFRLAFLACSLLCLTFLLREVDVQDHSLPRVLVLLGSGMGRDLILITAWSIVGIRFAMDWKAELRTFRCCLLSQPGIFMIAGGVFVVVGSLFDSQILNVRRYGFYEELAELDGHYLILGSAVAALLGLEQGRTRANPLLADARLSQRESDANR